MLTTILLSSSGFRFVFMTGYQLYLPTSILHSGQRHHTIHSDILRVDLNQIISIIYTKIIIKLILVLTLLDKQLLRIKHLNTQNPFHNYYEYLPCCDFVLSFNK